MSPVRSGREDKGAFFARISGGWVRKNFATILGFVKNFATVLGFYGGNKPTQNKQQ